MKTLSFILLLCLLFIGTTYSIPQKSSKDTVFVKSQSTPDHASLDAYKLLFQTAHESLQSERETNHWFITTVVTFLILAVGSQYFINTKINNSKLEKLRDDLKADIYRTSGERMLELSQLRNTIDEQIHEMDAFLKREVVKVGHDTETKIIELQKFLLSNQNSTKAEVKLLQSERALKFADPDNAYSLALDALVIQLENEDSPYSALHQINLALQKILKIKADDEKYLRGLLNKVPTLNYIGNKDLLSEFVKSLILERLEEMKKDTF